MKCLCFPRKCDLVAMVKLAGQTARLMVGVADHETYLRHMALSHPQEVTLSEAEFFRNRLSARYQRGAMRCC